jgi:GNAT superfamily N-acetyltransferase
MITKLDITDTTIRQRVVDFLTLDESHALFLLGNLRNNVPNSFLYVAHEGERWLGLIGYYENYRAAIPFTKDPTVAANLAHHVAQRHRLIDWVNGIDYSAKPACDALIKLGYTLANDPRQVFMVSTQEPELQPHEERVRRIEPRDYLQTARLLRLLNHPVKVKGKGPVEVSTEELKRIRLNPIRFVLEEENTLACTACTNGLGLSAYQILGVATDPAFRRKGYASAVCAKLMRHMKSLGAKKSVLFTQHTNTAAIHCYEKLGFHKEGEFVVAKLSTPTQH